MQVCFVGSQRSVVVQHFSATEFQDAFVAAVSDFGLPYLSARYGSVKPFFDKEQSCGPETTKRLICDPNHPHWHTKPDPERAYVGLATSSAQLTFDAVGINVHSP